MLCHTYGMLQLVRKTTIYLDEADELLIARAAAERGTSRTDLIREAIRRHLGAEGARPRPDGPLGNSGRDDIARRVDDYLAEGFGQ